MTKNVLFFIFVLVLAGLNMAVIRRNEDPIRDTQTSPISYQQKMEEEKDGKKGPLAYSLQYNPSDKFMTASPVAAEGKQVAAENAAETQGAGAEWWEESTVSEKTPAEPSNKEFPAYSESAPAENPEAAQPGPAGEGESAPPAPGSQGDNWW